MGFIDTVDAIAKARIVTHLGESSDEVIAQYLELLDGNLTVDVLKDIVATLLIRIIALEAV